MEKIPVALATNEKYAQYCATTIASVLVNSSDEANFEFHILVAGMSDEIKNKFLELKKIRNCAISFIEVDKNLFKKFPVNFHFSLEAYFRFKLASLLPNIDKILYLDSDMIILKDLSSVFAVDVDGYYAGMVLESDIQWKSSFNMNRLGLPQGSPYFNSGLIIFNLKKIRENKIEKQLFNWASSNKERIILVDQDVINVVFNGYIKELPEEYNVQLHYYIKNNKKKILKFKEKPFIVHFSGTRKPWVSKEMFCANYYWQYANLLKW